jgi:hypothetical protein
MELVKWMIEEKAPVSILHGCQSAALAGHLEILQFLRQRYIDKKGSHLAEIDASSLQEAIAAGRYPIVEWIVNQGVELTTVCLTLRCFASNASALFSILFRSRIPITRSWGRLPIVLL